ncbi:MAG: glutamate dehydrogenase, partial [Cellvibrionaceae bacterium]
MTKIHSVQSKIKIDEINQLIAKRLPKTDAAHLSTFTSSLFSLVAEDDVESYVEEDLKGLIATSFRHMQVKPTSQSFLFNPNVEEHGWQSQHSVLILHHRDVRYLIDSIRNMLGKKQIKIHKVFHAYFVVKRDAKGAISHIVEQGQTKSQKLEGVNELFLYMEIDHHSRSADIKELNSLINKTIANVEVVAKDYPDIVNHVDRVIEHLDQSDKQLSADTVTETKIFLEWLKQGHFTFLAYDEYLIDKESVKSNKESCLGLFRQWSESDELFEFMSKDQLVSAGIENPIIFSKSGHLSSVHRLAYLDYVVINRFDESGKVVGGYRFMGLYKHNVYLNSATDIPLIREKIQRILDSSKIPPDTYNYVELSHILGTFPRDELFQASVDYLLDVGLNVLYIQERRKVKLFLRENIDQRFITAIFYAPKDILNSRLREQVYALLAKNIDVESSTNSTWFSESSLARCRFVFKLKSPLVFPLDHKKLEQDVIHLARDWNEDLQVALNDAYGEERGLLLYRQYRQAFPAGYTDENSPRVAVADIERMQTLSSDDNKQLAFSFYRSITPDHNELKIKIYHRGTQLSLSAMIPVLENFGLKVIEEYPYDIEQENEIFWIYNFTVDFPDKPDIEPNDYRDNLSDAFIAVWRGDSDSDGFNSLILKTGLNWRQITMLRAYSRYMKQISFGFSQKFISRSLVNHTDIVKKLVTLFDCLFNPTNKRSEKTANRLAEQLNHLFDSVSSLSEDRILRQYLELMQATLRTNFFQKKDSGKEGVDEHKEYLSLKLDPSKLKNIPLPRPKFEIFVYSSRVEGVHLRGGKVARGGLRW